MEKEKLNLIGKFAQFFIKNYQISILLIVFLVVGGLYGYQQLPRQGMPEVEIPYAVVTAVYPGASQQEVEKNVTNKLEASLDGIDDIKSISSTSAEGFSSVVIEFEADAKVKKSLDDVRRQIDSVTDLPEDVDSPSIIEAQANVEDIIISVAGDKPVEELAAIAEGYKKEIDNIQGVDTAAIWGGKEEEVVINLDLEKINQLGLSYQDISQAIQAANFNLPGGTLTEGETSLPIQVEGKFQSLDDLKNVSLGPIKLSDIATIELQDSGIANIYKTGYADDDQLKSSETVVVLVTAKKDADVLKVSEEVETALSEYDRTHEEQTSGTRRVMIYDTAKEINGLLGDLFTNAWQGLLAILIVLFIFISFRSAIVSAIIIPLVMLSSFLVISFTSLSLNFITLYSLILALGIIIDNAIVVVEGVQRNIRSGQPKIEAAVNAVNDLGPALIAATLTTVLVFIPMMFLGGITGEFVKYIPYTVVITLIGSILLAFSITPFLSRFILGSKRQMQAKDPVGKISEKIISVITSIVGYILKSKSKIIISLVLVTILVGASIYVGTRTEVKLWPEVDDSEYFQISVKYPENASDELKKEKLAAMSQSLVDLYNDSQTIQDNVKNFAPLTFPREGLMSDQELYIVNLVPSEEATVKNAEIISLFQNKLDEISDLEVKVSGMMSGPPESEYPIEIQIADDDFNVLEKASRDLGDHLAGLEGVKKVDYGLIDSKLPQASVVLNRDAIAADGLSPGLIAGLVRTVYNAQKVSELTDQETGETMEIKMGFDTGEGLDELRNLPVGQKTLGDYATVEKVDVFKNISHYDQRRYVEVRATLEEGIDATGVTSQMQDYANDEKLEELGLDSDAVTYRGEFESEAQAFDDFVMMMIVSLIAIFALLAFQFKSFAQPFIIMLAIPLACIGVFPSLMATGNPISFMALIGLVVLMGIVVNNSIILIDRFNKLRIDPQYTLYQAVLEGVSQRTRPIIATTLTTIAGILPLTITEYYWRGMGITVISGLIASAIFVLIIIPVVYYLYIAALGKIQKRSKKD